MATIQRPARGSREYRTRLALHAVILSNDVVHFMERENPAALDAAKDALGREYADGAMALLREMVHREFPQAGPSPSDADIREMGMFLARELAGFGNEPAKDRPSTRRGRWGSDAIVFFEGGIPVGFFAIQERAREGGNLDGVDAEVRVWERRVKPVIRPSFGVWVRR